MKVVFFYSLSRLTSDLNRMPKEIGTAGWPIEDLLFPKLFAFGIVSRSPLVAAEFRVPSPGIGNRQRTWLCSLHEVASALNTWEENCR